MSLQELVAESFREVRSRQQLVTANLTGNAFLGFIVYSWLALNDLNFAAVKGAAFMLLGVVFFVIWLQATTFSAFHPGADKSTYMPALRRLHLYLPWATALVGTGLLFRWMSSVLGNFVWVVGVGVILAVLPLASQAAGGGFSRQRAVDIVFNERYWISGVGLLVLGFWLPSVLLAWIPEPNQPFLVMLVSGIRLGFAYFLAIGSWVLLAAIIGQLGGLESVDKKAAAVASDATSDPTGNLDTQPASPGTGAADPTSR